MPPSRNDIRNDNGDRIATCPTCRQEFTPIRRQSYCTPACRQAAWRARHPQPRPAITIIAPATSRRAVTVYRCPRCDTRYLGQQWCHDCHTPCTRYAAWRDEGIFAQLNVDLTALARVKAGRDPQPTAAVIDTQSVKTSSNSPTATQGTDAAKRSWAANGA